MSDQKSEQAPGKGKSGRKRVIVIASAALVLLGGGGGAAWHFMKPGAGDESSGEHRDEKRKRIFANLEPFTVNLADEGGDRFAQISMVLEVSEAKSSADLTSYMPAVRNAILMLLSAKHSKDIMSIDGKQRLADEIALAVGGELGWFDEDAPRLRKTSAGRKHDAAGAGADDGDDAKDARRKKSRRAAVPNPVAAVHFVQFIVQ